MMFRTEVGYIFMSRSRDRGVTWTQAKKLPDLPNHDSKVHLLWLGSKTSAASRDGAIDDPLAIVYNDHQSLRTDLRIALSWDGGHAWERAATLEKYGPPKP